MNLMEYMKAQKTILAVITFTVLPNITHADTIGFADVVVEYFDSGNGSLSCPEGQGGVFPPPASTATCVSLSVVLGDDSGPTSDYLSLSTGSFITVGFTDDLIFDGVGNDIFISEVGDAQENAEIYVSSVLSTDPDDFTFLGIANGNTITSFDLETIGFTSQVRAIKILSLENGGFPSAPGFDLAHVEAINFSAIPVPATAWLFASGLIGLIGIAKRNR